MSFVPTPTQANASSNNNARVTPAAPPSGGVVLPVAEVDDAEIIFKLRTFDVYWVEKHALMYKDGTTTVGSLDRCGTWEKPDGVARHEIHVCHRWTPPRLC